ncbi:MAG: integrase [Hyphomicrobiaceae bacterium]|jgi:integrase
MPILPHNQRAIDGLKPTPDRVLYRSESVTGLVLEVMPSGKKTWRVRYRTPGGRRGKTRAFTIGDAAVVKLGPALDKAKEILAAVQVEGRDPHAEKAAIPAGGSFEALFADWFERHAKVKKKSWQHDADMYRRHVHERMGRLIAAEIKRAEVATVLDDIAQAATGIQANRAQSLISAVFTWAVNEGRIDHSPVFRLPKRGVESSRERILSDAEIKTFWHGLAAGPLGTAMEHVLRLALITGQRRSEIAQAPKAEFDLGVSSPSWTIAGSRTKNGVMHRVPLTPLAANIFADAIAESQTPFVFPGKIRADAAIDPHAVTRAMARLRTELGIADATVHDLRRTVGTNLAKLGVSKDIRARVLNHVDGARSVTDAVYNQHEFWTEKRVALETWETELRRIVSL